MKPQTAEGVAFERLRAFSDGCRAQFFSALFFFFLSCFTTTFGIFVVWSWFCSCHGKCDCDPEGGAFKKSANEYEGKDSSLSDRRKTIRNARELALFGREKMTEPSKEFFQQRWQGCVSSIYPLHPPSRPGGYSAQKCSEGRSKDLPLWYKHEG